MESAPELLRLFVQALALFATSLDRWFHIPWPLPIAVLFVPVVATLDVVVWYLRGMIFLIPCNYPKVKEGLCSRQTLGEWHRCWYHRRRRMRKTDRHQVDPTLRRWKTRMHKGEAIETAEVGGRGFLSMRSHRDTLLYHQGFTRPPRDVFKRIPAVFHDYKSRAMERWANLKSLGIRGLVPLMDQGARQVLTSNVLPGVIYATRLTLAMVAIGLVLVGVSIVVPTSISVIFEYCATFSFIIALAVTRAGHLESRSGVVRIFFTGGRKVDSRPHCSCYSGRSHCIVRTRCRRRSEDYRANCVQRLYLPISRISVLPLWLQGESQGAKKEAEITKTTPQA